ncbi:hypothetical protein H5368_01265 [Luteimonas sp. MC1782]|uniref:hypothetical protein n=1 Tax=Luteimonas sp. MC1782 TaxID=2760305 RepID=UPI0015FFA0F3|nr:hypothetical protein [Luteimonas sp. MC1782]MBB1471654.1 hypothetical protein [Luteimonas sp. MC1782]
MKLVIGFLAALVLSGCASSHVLVGQAREPISAEEVRLYVEPPPRYETVALLEASNRGAVNFTDQQRTNTVIARMKEEAAALGANGILLQGMGNQYAGSVGSGNAWVSGNSAYGVGISSAIMNRTGNGLAIYVPDGAQAVVVPQAVPVAMAPAAAPPAAVHAEAVAPPPATTAPAPVQTPYEPDPAKRCDACGRLTSP